jgi:hypothetical protein
MFSRFTKLFKKNDLDEQRAFQARVARILRELYPDKSLELSADPLTLKCGETTVGLTNLKANFLFGPQTDIELRVLVTEHFRKAFAGTLLLNENDLSWATVKSQLMPQLMPRSFLDRMDLVHFPFGDDEIVLGIVIDGDEAYSYILKSGLKDWEVSEDEVKRTAFDNLSRRSKGIEMTSVPGDNGLFLVQTMDGFDAVRIVEPAMRSFIGEHLGLPFYFGVPNRDFLICWSKNGDQSFNDQMRSQISSDCDEQPYPLSRLAFEVTVDNEIQLANRDSSDSRASTANKN